jgi:haloalkane dehalogenase
MMNRVGILDRSSVTDAGVDAYPDLVLCEDGGAAYLEIMRRLRDDASGPRGYGDVVDARRVPYPVQIVWGASDPILSPRRYGWPARRMTGLSHLAVVPARHFLDEDQAPAVAELVAGFCGGSRKPDRAAAAHGTAS